MNLSPFNIVAEKLWRIGYSVIPNTPAGCNLRGNGQVPGEYSMGQWFYMKDWTRFNKRLPTEIEMEVWSKWPEANVGLVCGPVGNIIGVDFDHDVDGLHDVIKDLIPDSPVKKFGSKGFTAFYQYRGEPSTGWSYKHKQVLDLISHGKETVLPPSVHPNGKNYKWLTKETLLTVPNNELPVLPDDFQTLVNAIFDKYEGRDAKAARQGSILTPSQYVGYMEQIEFEDATPDKVIEALNYIDPDDSYHQWVEIGMAIKSQFGESGFYIWDQWSSMGPKYQDKGNQSAMNSKWKSFDVGGSKRIGSLFMLAQQRGFVNHGTIKVNFDEADFNSRVDLNNFIKKPKKKEKQKSYFDMSEVYEFDLNTDNRQHKKWNIDAPGPIATLAEWILQTSLYPEPELAIAAAIPFMGVVKSHRIQSPDGLRTNIYTLGIAGSGQGKNHARSCIAKIAGECDRNDLIGGNPASAAGLFRALLESDGKKLLQIDEFGRILQTYTKKGPGNHLAMIPTMMMELFSNANTTFRGAEYSNYDGKRERKDIEQPCLCVYGTSTPRNFYEALTSNDAVDGFLSRWLIFDAGKPSEVEYKDHSSINVVPNEIIEQVQWWLSQGTNHNPVGDLDYLLRINPRVIAYSGHAEGLLDQFARVARKKMVHHMEKNTGLDAIYSRMAEHAIKIAMIACSDDYVINRDIMDWACSLVSARADYICRAIEEHIADNELEQEYKKVLRIIKSAGRNGIRHNVLTRKTQTMRAIRRTEIISALLEHEEITAINKDTSTKGAVFYYYRDFSPDQG